MQPTRSLSASAALAALFCASAAQAEVTAEQVWQSWMDYNAAFGQTISAGSTEMQGDTLVVKDVKFGTTMADGSSTEGSIAEVRLKEMGDGTVQVTMSNDIPVLMKPAPVDGVATDLTMNVAQKDALVTVSGAPEAMDFDYTAPELSMSMDKVAVDGKPAPMKMQFTMKGARGKYHVEQAAGRTMTSDMTADTLDIAMTGAEPESGGTFNLTGTMSGLSGTAAMTMPEGADIKNMSAAMQAGMGIDGNFAYTTGTYKIEATGADGNFNVDTTGGAGKLTFKMSKDGLTYGGESGESTMSVTGPMPFPIEASIAQSAFNLAMPVAKTETAQPAALLIKLIDLKVSDALWNMIDPGTQLPRDPATLVIDLSGAIRPLVDLFDPKMAEQMAGNAEAGAMPPNPFEVTEARINQLQVKAVGAELTGTGAVTFDNSAGTPKPVGAVDLSLTGANALMDKLVAMGLMPEDQIMGARMMLGMFAVPTGDDALSSKIEFKEDGGIYANGQRIQ